MHLAAPSILFSGFYKKLSTQNLSNLHFPDFFVLCFLFPVLVPEQVFCCPELTLKGLYFSLQRVHLAHPLSSQAPSHMGVTPMPLLEPAYKKEGRKCKTFC